MQYLERRHLFIIISEAVEDFILAGAQELGVKLEDYGLPSELKELKKRTKSVKSANDPVFKKLFKRLRNATDFHILEGILGYIVSRKYTYTSEELKAFFPQQP